ncbi:MAG TPA: hypothetical protein VMF09_08875 [Solirubrobacteraceae bacterium]|nr:hypothetical protein [Solirubrobacteraceae bacterium]
MRRGLTLTAALALIAILPAAALASSAQAALISTATCNDATLTQPFLRWGDSNSYELVPGGDFEGSLAGWSLSGGAQRVAGGEPYEVDGSVGAHSLELPAGASAQSPFTCVTAAYPTFRLFARNEGLLSSVIVQVVSQTALGTVVLPLGVIAGSSQWQPTPPMLTGSIVTGALSGGTAQVALRFTALGGGSRIDDVFVDPRMI